MIVDAAGWGGRFLKMFQDLVTFTTNKFRSQIQTRGFILKLGSQLYYKKKKRRLKKRKHEIMSLVELGII